MIAPPSTLCLILYGIPITQDESVKYLGVIYISVQKSILGQTYHFCMYGCQASSGLPLATGNSILQVLNAPPSCTSLLFSPPRPLLVCLGPNYALYSDKLESVQKFTTNKSHCKTMELSLATTTILNSWTCLVVYPLQETEAFSLLKNCESLHYPF